MVKSGGTPSTREAKKRQVRANRESASEKTSTRSRLKVSAAATSANCCAIRVRISSFSLPYAIVTRDLPICTLDPVRVRSDIALSLRSGAIPFAD